MPELNPFKFFRKKDKNNPIPSASNVDRKESLDEKPNKAFNVLTKSLASNEWAQKNLINHENNTPENESLHRFTLRTLTTHLGRNDDKRDEYYSNKEQPTPIPFRTAMKHVSEAVILKALSHMFVGASSQPGKWVLTHPYQINENEAESLIEEISSGKEINNLFTSSYRKESKIADDEYRIEDYTNFQYFITTLGQDFALNLFPGLDPRAVNLSRSQVIDFLEQASLSLLFLSDDFREKLVDLAIEHKGMVPLKDIKKISAKDTRRESQ